MRRAKRRGRLNQLGIPDHETPSVTRGGAARRKKPPAGDESAVRAKIYERGQRLSMKLMDILEKRVARHLTAERALEAERRKESPDKERIRALREKVLTQFDLSNLNRDMQDRFGAPRRSQVEIDALNAPPLAVVIEGGLGWPEQEPTDGMVAGGGGASDRGDAVEQRH